MASLFSEQKKLSREENEFIAHSDKQYDVIMSDEKITAAVTGIQWGKTSAGALWLKRLMHTHQNKADSFLLTAPNYKIMGQSSLPAFLAVMEGCGQYKEQKAVFETNWGSKCYMRTGTDADSVVGITNVRGAWCDEAGKYGLYFWENIQTRCSFKDAPMCITTSPYAMNWVYKDIIRQVERGKAPHIKLIQAASWENPHFPKADIERRKTTMDARRFQAVYGGKFSKMQGLVYDCFDEDTHVIEPFPLPIGTVYIGGIDWGFTEPFVLTIRAITPDNRHYQVSETYRSGMRDSEIVEVCRQKHALYGLKMVYCGPDRPEKILELCANGIPATPATNSILQGIEKHYELVKTGRYKIFKGTSPYTIDEHDTYHYPSPDDLEPDQNAKDQKPVQQDDHALDSNRYISVMTYKGSLTRKPSVVNEGEKKKLSDSEQIRQLLKTKKNTSEVWS